MNKKVKVEEFYIQESIFNKNLFVLVAIDQFGQEWVVGGNHHYPTYLMPGDQSSDIENHKTDIEKL